MAWDGPFTPFPTGPKGTRSARLAQGKSVRIPVSRMAWDLPRRASLAFVLPEQEAGPFLGVRAYIFQPSSDSPSVCYSQKTGSEREREREREEGRK